MKAVHRPILTIAEIVVLYFSIGLAATLWVIGLFLLYFGIVRMSVRLVPVQDRHDASRAMAVCIYTAAALAIGLFIFIFIRFGWIAAIGFIILNIGVPSPSIRRSGSISQLVNNYQELFKQYQDSRQMADLKRVLDCLQEALHLIPSDSPIRPFLLNELGMRLGDSYQDTKNPADLDACITAHQQAVQATPLHSPELPHRLSRLSIRLRERFKITRDLSDLGASITALQQAIQVLPPNDPIRPIILGKLDIQLYERYIHNKDITDLNAAIAAIKQAIKASPSNSPDRSGFLEILGRRQHERYKRTEELIDLDASIAAYQQAVQAPPHKLLDQPALLNNLGSVLNERYERTGDVADLDAAIATFEQSSKITPPDSPKWLVYVDNLSSKLRERYKRTGNRADLDAATAVFGKVVQATNSTLPDQPALVSSLGQRQFEQYAQTGNLADLEMAIALFEQALHATPPNSPDWIARLNNRGIMLRERYTRTRDRADLEVAIDDFRKVIAATPSDSPDLPSRLNNLIVGLVEYYECTGDLSDLSTQVAKFEQVIKTVSPISSLMLSSLGGARLALYEHRHSLDDLSELNAAISAFEQAIQSTTDSSNQSIWLTNLGTALIDRYEQTGNKTDLDAAIINFQQATQTLSADSPWQYTLLSNLARSLHQRFAHAYNLIDLEAAISTLEKCWSILHLRFTAIPVIYQLGQQRQEAVIAADLVTAYLEQAKLCSSPGTARLLKTLDDVNGSKLLLTQTIAMFALSLIKAYQERREQQDSRLLSVPPRVLEITEGNKSRLLTQLIGRGPLPLPPGLSSEIAAREQQLLTKLTMLDTEELVSHNNLYPIEEGNAHLQLLRLQQRQTTLHELEVLWSRITPIGPEGTEYVALRRGAAPTWQELTRLTKALGPTTALLSFFTTANQALLFLLRAGWRAPRFVEVQLNQAGWTDLRKRFEREVYTPNQGQGKTWEQPLLPLLIKARPHLQGVERLILAPAGNGHLLPWGVLAEHAEWHTSAGQPLPLVTLPALGILPRLRQRPHTSPGLALVVGNPRNDLPLPYAEAEAKEVAKRFGTEPLLGTAATKSAVLTRFASATLIHLATHASFNPGNPLESGILLADGVLTAREVLQHRLQADLLVLSACQSGRVGFLGGEELAGLSQAFLQAGVRSLLVSLWKVNDPATAALIQAFYTARQAGADKAMALRQAMTQLRQEDPRWSHPHYWGAFILVGDWD